MLHGKVGSIETTIRLSDERDERRNNYVFEAVEKLGEAEIGGKVRRQHRTKDISYRNAWAGL